MRGRIADRIVKTTSRVPFWYVPILPLLGSSYGVIYKIKAKVSHHWVYLATLLAAAFLVRLGVRMAFGEEYFWTNSCKCGDWPGDDTGSRVENSPANQKCTERRSRAHHGLRY